MAPSRSPVVTMSDGEVTVAVHDEFDMAATFAIEPTLERALQAPELRALRLDLSGLTFIDSVGLSVVIRLAAELEGRGVRMRIVPGPRHVHRVFTSVGMASMLPFETDAPA